MPLKLPDYSNYPSGKGAVHPWCFSDTRFLLRYVFRNWPCHLLNCWMRPCFVSNCPSSTRRNITTYRLFGFTSNAILSLLVT